MIKYVEDIIKEIDERDPIEITDSCAIGEELQRFAQWLWDNHYLVDEAFTIRLVEQYKSEQMKEKNMEWIKDIPPINEQPILILTKRRYRGDDRYEIVRGFYTDGNTNTEDSDYCWLDTDNWEYDEENDAYIIPQGYWEERWYGNGEDSVAVIDDKVVGWCRLDVVIYEAKKQLKEQTLNRIF